MRHLQMLFMPFNTRGRKMETPAVSKLTSTQAARRRRLITKRKERELPNLPSELINLLTTSSLSALTYQRERLESPLAILPATRISFTSLNDNLSDSASLIYTSSPSREIFPRKELRLRGSLLNSSLAILFNVRATQTRRLISASTRYIKQRCF